MIQALGRLFDDSRLPSTGAYRSCKTAGRCRDGSGASWSGCPKTSSLPRPKAATAQRF